METTRLQSSLNKGVVFELCDCKVWLQVKGVTKSGFKQTVDLGIP